MCHIVVAPRAQMQIANTRTMMFSVFHCSHSEQSVLMYSVLYATGLGTSLRPLPPPLARNSDLQLTVIANI